MMRTLGHTPFVIPYRTTDARDYRSLFRGRERAHGFSHGRGSFGGPSLRRLTIHICNFLFEGTRIGTEGSNFGGGSVLLLKQSPMDSSDSSLEALRDELIDDFLNDE
ncbi:hypothetical protein JHK86_010604 [Glycine max]|nr:hypothetical protein JHK86_010604 [Glycine max]